MYAAHFAAGLAIKSRVPETPTWALLIGAFLPDFFWIAFGLAGLEPSQGPAFFDDWSHSLAMVILWGAVLALLFWRRGFSVVSALWLAVFSHFLLDLPIHPKNIALYLHSSVHLGWNLWDFGAGPFWFATRYWLDADGNPGRPYRYLRLRSQKNASASQFNLCNLPHPFGSALDDVMTFQHKEVLMPPHRTRIIAVGIYSGGAAMKRFAGLMLVVVGVLLGVQTVAAQEWSQPWARERIAKSPRHSEWVTVKHDGRNVETLVVYPESKDKRPVVLIIHEIFGLSDWAQELADEVAAAGYIAVAPDLLSGMGPNGGRTNTFPAGGVMEAVSNLNADQVTADLNAAADYALKLPAANGKLYVAGFCWGGGQSFRFATNRPDLTAAFVFYGPPPASDALSRIKAAVYGFYAGNDARIDATIPDTVSAMKAAGKTYEPVTYDGAGHGFMRAGEAPDANDANKKARDDAWARWKTLLAN